MLMNVQLDCRRFQAHLGIVAEAKIIIMNSNVFMEENYNFLTIEIENMLRGNRAGIRCFSVF